MRRRTAGTATGATSGLEALETQLAREASTGTFCHGDAPTIADICLVPQLANARRVDLDLAPYPTLLRIESACAALPAFAARGAGAAAGRANNLRKYAMNDRPAKSGKSPRCRSPARTDRFPVRHIYCVGRNYAEHAKEMGGDASKEPPFFFTKPADAVVPVVPPAVGRVRYPLATKNFHHEIELVVAIGGVRRQARARSSARDGLGLCGRPRHDAPRSAERHAREEAAVGHRQIVRAMRRRSVRSIRSRAVGQLDARQDLARRQRRAPASRAISRT